MTLFLIMRIDLKKIIIVGAGEVGSFLANKLSSEQHDVTLIEEKQSKVEELNSSLDALVIQGNGGSPSSLIEAGAEDSDLIIAVTDNVRGQFQQFELLHYQRVIGIHSYNLLLMLLYYL